MLVLLSPFPRGDCRWIAPQAFPSFASFQFELLEHRIGWGILSIPPTPPGFDEFLIDVRSIGSHDISERTALFIFPVALNGYIFGIDKGGRRMFCAGAKRLAFFRTIDAAKANPFLFSIAEHLDGIPVEDADDFAGERERICTAEETKPSQEGYESHE